MFMKYQRILVYLSVCLLLAACVTDGGGQTSTPTEIDLEPTSTIIDTPIAVASETQNLETLAAIIKTAVSETKTAMPNQTSSPSSLPGATTMPQSATLEPTPIPLTKPPIITDPTEVYPNSN